MFAAMKSANDRFEELKAFTSFVRCAGAIMVGGGPREAAQLLEAKGWTKEANTFRKSAVAATTSGSSGMNITTYLGSFLALLRNASAFDRIAQSAMRLPQRRPRDDLRQRREHVRRGRRS
jgi:hypothetical protein